MTAIGFLGALLTCLRGLAFRSGRPMVALMVAFVCLSSLGSLMLVVGKLNHAQRVARAEQPGTSDPITPPAEADRPDKTKPDAHRPRPLPDRPKEKTPRKDEPKEKPPADIPPPKVDDGGTRKPLVARRKLRGRADTRTASRLLPRKRPVTERVPKPDTPPPKEEDPDKTLLADLVKALKTKGKRVSAAQKLAKMGSKGRPAARAICEALLGANKEEGPALVEALEKVHPDLAKHVLTLFVDTEYQHRWDAIRAIGQMKESGKPAAPVLIAHARNAMRGRTGGSSKSRFYALDFNLVDEDIRALGAIGSTEAGTIAFLGEIVRIKDPSRGYLGAVACTTLGHLAKADPKMRKAVVPHLIAGLALLERSGMVQPEMCLASIRVLSDLGDDAAPALPDLRKLRLCAVKEVREGAAEAVRTLEKTDK
jgi:hypothetical protein